jgi:hypothetical protein
MDLARQRWSRQDSERNVRIVAVAEGGAVAYTVRQITETVERVMSDASGPAEIWRRVTAELPGVEAEDVMIAGRLRQARIHLAAGDWAAASGCAVQLATDLTGIPGITQRDAWAFLRRLENPMVAELVRLFDEPPRT